MNPKSLLLKIVLSLLSASCHNKFPLQGYNVSGSSTPFSEISQSLGYLWMPTYSFELEEKNTFYTCAISPNLERQDFCAVLGTNTRGLHITLAIPNSFFREKHSLFLGTGSYTLGNTKSEIGKLFTHFWHLGLLGERAE